MARAAGSRSSTAPAARRGTWRGSSKPRSAGLAPAPHHEADAAGDHRQAEPLPHGHAESEGAEKGVGFACELRKKAQHAVADQEQSRHLAARARLAGEPPEQEKQRQAFARELIKLRRVARRVASAAKHHRPGYIADAAPKLAVDEVPQAPGGDSRRYERR